jgi:hypothetical protein
MAVFVVVCLAPLPCSLSWCQSNRRPIFSSSSRANLRWTKCVVFDCCPREIFLYAKLSLARRRLGTARLGSVRLPQLCSRFELLSLRRLHTAGLLCLELKRKYESIFSVIIFISMHPTIVYYKCYILIGYSTIVYYKCYILIGYSTVVYSVIDHGSRKSKGKQYGYCRKLILIKIILGIECIVLKQLDNSTSLSNC